MDPDLVRPRAALPSGSPCVSGEPQRSLARFNYPIPTPLKKGGVGWPTGLEPATTRITIWGSTIDLRPPTRTGNLEIPPPGVKGGENGAAGARLKSKRVEGLKRGRRFRGGARFLPSREPGRRCGAAMRGGIRPPTRLIGRLAPSGWASSFERLTDVRASPCGASSALLSPDDHPHPAAPTGD